MGKPYTITITDGSGTQSILNGNYSASVSSTGYDSTSIDPSTVNVTSSENSYAFTIEASGTLTLHVTETGTSEGTAIVGATFIRCDSEGNTYGSSITSDSNGDAVFNNVPYATSGAPTIYYKQTASDGDHEYSSDLASTSLSSQTSTVQITNSPAASRTIALTDANYSDLPIDSATITLN